MNLRSIYVAHPVGAPTHDGVAANIANAERWARWLMDTLPESVIQMPWLLYVRVLDDLNPAHRERGTRDGLRVVRSGIFTGIAACGGRISTGMSNEIEVGGHAGVPLLDLTRLGFAPPEKPWTPRLFEDFLAGTWAP